LLVHLGLLACAVAALGTLQLLHIRNAIHADVGLAFAGLVIVHLAQRRHRIAGMLARLWGFRRRVGRELRLLASDAILAFVTGGGALGDPRSDNLCGTMMRAAERITPAAGQDTKQAPSLPGQRHLHFK
jgi:hypothetical protein